MIDRMVDGVKGRNDYEIACSKLKVKEVVSEKAKVRARKIAEAEAEKLRLLEE